MPDEAAWTSGALPKMSTVTAKSDMEADLFILS
jgi:hypothetical protein